MEGDGGWDVAFGFVLGFEACGSAGWEVSAMGVDRREGKEKVHILRRGETRGAGRGRVWLLMLLGELKGVGSVHC